MKYALFTEIILAEDMPEKGVCRGDVATIVEYHPVPTDEDGYTLEVFNVLGETIQVLTVSESQIAPLTANKVFNVRELTPTP